MAAPAGGVFPASAANCATRVFAMLDSESSQLEAGVPTWNRQRPRMQALVGRHRAFFILVGVLVGQLLLLSFQITRNQNVRLIQVWAVAVFEPFERTLHKVVGSTSVAWQTFGRLWRVQQQNQELQAQLGAARAHLQQLTEQANEAQRLRTLLEFKERLSFQTVASEVIATSPGESANAVLIDKGADYGLTTDLAVITPEGVVGKTIAVFPHTAQVLLLTDSSSGVGCMLEHSRTQGILKGGGQASAQLYYVLNEESIAPGEPVLTSGLDQIFPKGLPVGTVLQASSGTVYKKIVVRPAAALNRLETVLVVTRPNSAPQQAMNLPGRP